jgi:hypothetical protein
MKKTLIALSTGLFLASGAAMAQTSAIDVTEQPERSTSQDLVPNFGLFGGDNYSADEMAADERFGDATPEVDTSEGSIGIDYTPTASTGEPSPHYDDFSADNGFGDHSPSPQILQR